MIVKAKAESCIERAALLATEGKASAEWVAKVDRLSLLCETANIKTHIAMFGTSALAKATWLGVDLYAFKPKLEESKNGPYSARTLCQNVRVPLSAKHGFNIGATGREPLNNQPYFRMKRLDDDIPIKEGSRPSFNYMQELVAELTKLDSEDAALDALAAFIQVRRRYQKKYVSQIESIGITLDEFPEVVQSFVAQSSEGGRRAQAVAAGILDVFAAGRVISGRINDPDRRSPGDVCIESATNPDTIEKAFEVRDKPVSESDVQVFVTKCLAANVWEPALILAAGNQKELSRESTVEWAQGLGVTVSLFYGWRTFIEETFFWSGPMSLEAMHLAVVAIGERLVAVEASLEAIEDWTTRCMG